MFILSGLLSRHTSFIVVRYIAIPLVLSLSLCVLFCISVSVCRCVGGWVGGWVRACLTLFASYGV